MRVLVTGGSGVLGRAAIPCLSAAGHEVRAPARGELDLFDAQALSGAVAGMDAILHLATRIPPPERMREPAAWRENDRLRGEASRLLVDAALAAGTALYVQPTVTFVYPPDVVADEETALADVAEYLRSALIAEAEAARFAAAGRRGVVLRMGLLDGGGHRQRHAAAAIRLDAARGGRRARARRGPCGRERGLQRHAGR